MCSDLEHFYSCPFFLLRFFRASKWELTHFKGQGNSYTVCSYLEWHCLLIQTYVPGLGNSGVCVCVCVCAQSCPTPLDPTDCSPPGFSVHGILLARILKWVAISYSRGSSQPKDQTWVSGISWVGKWVLYHCTTWAALVSQDMVSKLWFQPAWEVMMVTWGSWFSHLIKNGQFELQLRAIM